MSAHVNFVCPAAKSNTHAACYGVVSEVHVHLDAFGSSVRGQSLPQVQMKASEETLQELNNTMGHLAWQRDQCLFDWLERGREVERGGREGELPIEMQVKYTSPAQVQLHPSWHKAMLACTLTPVHLFLQTTSLSTMTNKKQKKQRHLETKLQLKHQHSFDRVNLWVRTAFISILTASFSPAALRLCILGTTS